MNASGTLYEWGAEDDAMTLVSNGQGQFEITGLPEGTYYLEETKAPEGFAKLTEAIEFKVGAGSYTSETGNKAINYKHDAADGAQKDALQVENKNLTIPQTGGIGSLIFVVAGLAIMAFAYTAYKKSQYQEA